MNGPIFTPHSKCIILRGKGNRIDWLFELELGDCLFVLDLVDFYGSVAAGCHDVLTVEGEITVGDGSQVHLLAVEEFEISVVEGVASVF